MLANQPPNRDGGKAGDEESRDTELEALSSSDFLGVSREDLPEHVAERKGNIDLILQKGSSLFAAQMGLEVL